MNSEFYCIMEDGEQIIQAKKGYPDYWFVSNKGRLFRVYKETKEHKAYIRILKPLHCWCGKNRSRLQWYYRPHGKPVLMNRFIAEHFFPEDVERLESQGIEWEAHHTHPITWFDENQPQLANRADNLQVEPKEIHKEQLKCLKGDSFFQKKIEESEKLEAAEYLIPGNLTDLFAKMLEGNPIKAIEVFPNEKGNIVKFTTADKLKFRNNDGKKGD